MFSSIGFCFDSLIYLHQTKYIIIKLQLLSDLQRFINNVYNKSKDKENLSIVSFNLQDSNNVDDAKGETAEQEIRTEREGTPDGVAKRAVLEEHQQIVQIITMAFI